MPRCQSLLPILLLQDRSIINRVATSDFGSAGQKCLPDGCFVYRASVIGVKLNEFAGSTCACW